MKRILSLLLASALALPVGTALAEDATHPRVKMETSLGDITLELDGEKAPISTLNFLQYAESGFYNGTIFHRVMPGFMIQGGGYTESLDEKGGTKPPIKNEWKNGLKNNRGSIAMARTQVPDSATAQFFINVVDNPALDTPRDGAAYAVFGKVVEGMETVDKIKDTETINNEKLPMGKVVPKTTVLIKSATVLTKYDKAALEEASKPKLETDVKNFIDAKAKELGKPVQTSGSGLSWFVLKEGTGDKSPKPTDTVSVHYTGTFLDGKVFDSSVQRGQPAEFPLNGVIKGWTEGVGYMKVGEKRLFVIPYDLAYGEAGRPPQIPAKSTLVFEVELLAIK